MSFICMTSKFVRCCKSQAPTKAYFIPCSMKIWGVLIFADFAECPRSAKINSRRKKLPQNKTPQKCTPFSPIKNSAFLKCKIALLGRYPNNRENKRRGADNVAREQDYRCDLRSGTCVHVYHKRFRVDPPCAAKMGRCHFSPSPRRFLRKRDNVWT